MCDTFLALPPATSDGSIIFGKNSDREPNEAQALEYYPSQTYARSDDVQCTYRSIPQVRKTYATLLCRPFWMWGAEIGANEKGVVIGNEAVWTRMPLQKTGGLTGMDLLRLALERSSSASRALEVIVQLLSDFGQGGICGYEDKRMAYHNSYIIADPGGGWVLETAGDMWAAVQIKEFYSISNGLTIGEDFDECHPQLIETARKKKWLKMGATFNFAHCYSDWFYTTFSASSRRCGRSRQLLGEGQGALDVASGIKILRDHKTIEYRPDSHFLGNRICAHAAGKPARHATQTTGSLLAHLRSNRQTCFVTGTSAPCTSLFKPVRLADNMLPPIGPAPAGTYDARSLWWQHENLHRSVLLDHCNRLDTYGSARDELEDLWINRAVAAADDQCRDLTREAFRQARVKTEEWTAVVQSQPVVRQNKWFYRQYWQRQNARAGIAVK